VQQYRAEYHASGVPSFSVHQIRGEIWRQIRAANQFNSGGKFRVKEFVLLFGNAFEFGSAFLNPAFLAALCQDQAE